MKNGKKVEGLVEKIYSAGTAAGLDAIGFSDASDFTQTFDALTERKQLGYGAGMNFTFKNPKRSTSPNQTLPSVHSIITAGYHYGKEDDGENKINEMLAIENCETQKEEGKETSKNKTGKPAIMNTDKHNTGKSNIGKTNIGRANIAKYARQDFYKKLRSGLEEIAAVLKAAGYKSVILSDDNALVDRAAAHRAGLAWYGKNSNLIFRRSNENRPNENKEENGKEQKNIGSYFVIGSVLTDADLSDYFQAEPLPSECGSCVSCIKKCPTGAILNDGTIDARKCLAWLLQKTGMFPAEHRIALSNRIYGCDDCQTACPINKQSSMVGKATRQEIVTLNSSNGNYSPANETIEQKIQRDVAEENTIQETDILEPDVFEILEATDDELLERFAHFYIPKRDPKYLRRNALIALANIFAPNIFTGDKHLDKYFAENKTRKEKRNQKVITKESEVSKINGNTKTKSNKSQKLQTKILQTLKTYLTHSDPILRAHAVWAAKRLNQFELLSTQFFSPQLHTLPPQSKPNYETDPLVLEELRRPA